MMKLIKQDSILEHIRLGKTNTSMCRTAGVMTSSLASNITCVIVCFYQPPSILGWPYARNGSPSTANQYTTNCSRQHRNEDS